MVKRLYRTGLMIALIASIGISGCQNSNINTDNTKDTNITSSNSGNTDSSDNTNNTESTGAAAGSTQNTPPDGNFGPGGMTPPDGNFNPGDMTPPDGDFNPGDMTPPDAVAGATQNNTGTRPDAGQMPDNFGGGFAGGTTAGSSSMTEAVSGTYVSDAKDNKVAITDEFAIVSEKGTGNVIKDGSNYIITAAGTYTISGCLEGGSIIVDAGDDDKVNINLNGVYISNDNSAPIYIKNADSVKIKSEEGTYNEINDLRTEITEEDEAGAAIYAKCDLSLTGKGSLVVTSSCNNGIQTKDDLSVKNVTLSVTAVNNALKGNDSVEIESGNLILISVSGDGIKTSNSAISSKGNQKGTVTIYGGNVSIYACCDGIDAAYDAVIEDGNINIYTSKYSEYSDETGVETDSTNTTQTTQNTWFGSMRGGNRGGFDFGGSANANKTSYSSKGIKSGNEITINNGTINISCYDDAIHANMDALDNQNTGKGDLSINGGTVTITCADDAVHAENIVNINGGYINVINSYEGIEGNVININGGTTYVYASDDAVNASGGAVTPLINITGGYLDVTTPSGDTDAIDSNGNITMSGGNVLVKGGSSQGSMAGSVDVDGKITITGGSIAALGGICELPVNSVNCYVKQGQQFAAGSYEIKDSNGNTVISFELTTAYSSGWFCSDKLVTGNSYTLYKDGASLLTWTQEEGNSGDNVTGFGGFGGGNGGNGGFGKRR